MPRPDEGLIHAWLDGQLPPEEASRIEQLAATDPEWADAVAEARGLVAASSRILSALDHVPSGVIPKGGTAGAPRRLPWWTKAAAAVVIMAGGTVLVMQRASRPALSEGGEEQAAGSAIGASVPVATAIAPGTATKATGRAPMPSNTPGPVTGGVQDVQPGVRAAIVESKPETAHSDIRMTRSTPRTAPTPPSMARDRVTAMQDVTAPKPATASPSAPAEMESRIAAERAPAAKTVLDVRQKDAATERRAAATPTPAPTPALAAAPTAKAVAAVAPANAAPPPVGAAAQLAIPTLEPAEATARRVSGVMGGVASSSRTTCYQVRDAKSPSDAGVIMRSVRTDGDTLRLEPAQGTSALRAWIIWRGEAGHGAMTPTANGRGAVAVVATPSPCPAP